MRSREQLETDRVVAEEVSGRLRLPLSSRKWKGQAGEFQGAGVGSSLDFQDHREYSPGDDPRHINWQAFARTGQYTMKLYREEVRPVVDLFIDCSASMWNGESKARRSSELLYFLASSAHRAGASLQMILVNGAAERALSLESLMTHRWVDDVKGAIGEDPAAPPQLDRVRGRASAIRILLSDLLFEGDPSSMIRALHDHQGSGLIFCPFSRVEADPSWTGHYDFIDSERLSRHTHQISPAILTRYKQSYLSHFALWEESCRRHQIGLARVSAEGDFFEALQQQSVRHGILEYSP